jgi:hypothetical protein
MEEELVIILIVKHSCSYFSYFPNLLWELDGG